MENHIDSNTPVSEIVKQFPHSISLLEKYNIDFCCHGAQSFAQACQRVGVNTEKVLAEINSMASNPQPSTIRANDWPLNMLIGYIVENHHSYVKKSIPEITLLMDKVLAAHAQEHRELIAIKNLFDEIAEELSMHLHKEEEILFPAVLRILDLKNQNATINPNHSIVYPIDIMEQEHDRAGQGLYTIRELTNNYTLPVGACFSYSLLYSRLKEFEEDLHVHVHLENNILFPRALQVEKSIGEAVMA